MVTKNIKKIFTFHAECESALKSLYVLRRQKLAKGFLSHQENESFTIIERVLRRYMADIENSVQYNETMFDISDNQTQVTEASL